MMTATVRRAPLVGRDGMLEEDIPLPCNNVSSQSDSVIRFVYTCALAPEAPNATIHD